ncbi:MAG: CDP-glycerol glycerophosphotransferase family protein, partial [bacterium]|nr:CDP-glycerol glycerophosphotransferase family protein [bacterium]
ALFLQSKEVGELTELLKREKPDAIILTNVASDADAALIKSAKRGNIKTIGIPKSWDNMNKYGFRAKPDILVVWSEFMKREAMGFQNYLADGIKIVGIPQFDRYLDKSRIWSREKFLSEMGLEKDRQVLFFGSEGKLLPTDSNIASILSDLVTSESLKKKCQLLIRPHFGYTDDEIKFSHLFDKPHLKVDLYNEPSRGFRDHWDYSNEFFDRFVNCIYHSDIIISTYSTLALDGAAFDKPLINIGFDGVKTEPYERSVRRWEEVTYFKAVLDENAMRNVKCAEDMKSAINDYLSNPSLQSKERDGLRRKFCHKIDGQSGRRFAEVIEREIST